MIGIPSGIAVIFQSTHFCNKSVTGIHLCKIYKIFIKLYSLIRVDILPYSAMALDVVSIDFSSTKSIFFVYEFEQEVCKVIIKGDKEVFKIKIWGECGLGLQIPIQIGIVMRGVWGKHIRVIRL